MPDRSNETLEFSQSVIEQIGYYVYLLIDPLDEGPFYVGKGTGNRVFAHVNDAIINPQATDKLDRIRTIETRGNKVRHQILRHGLTEKEAFEIEASVIDLLGLDGLTNQVLGHESLERGKMSANDIMAQYDAHPISIEEPTLLVTVNKLFRYGMSPEELYEITRGNWVVGEQRNRVKYAHTVYRGIVREVFHVRQWFPIEARSTHQKTRTRWRFEGEVAHELRHYIGGDVSRYLTQNPVRYINCDP